MGNVQSASALDVLWRPAPGGELLDLGRVYRGPLALSRLHSTERSEKSAPQTPWGRAHHAGYGG